MTLSSSSSPRLLNSVSRVVLTGFMGSGKTTVGELLAKRLGWDFIDLDREIELREGRSVSQLFFEVGEVAFRRKESLSLARILGRSKAVLALGGGTPEELRNKLLLEQTPKTAVIHLAAPFTILIERCSKDGLASRPILADLEDAEQRYRRRYRIYERLANQTIDTSVRDVDSTVDTILEYLQEMG